MSGHNKWSQIKNRKGAQDAKKSLAFSKLLALVVVAAKASPDPDKNPRLRAAIQRARDSNVPLENIERAINKAAEQKDLTEVLIEAYGPEGVGMLIEGITDNTNRTVSEVRHLLDENGAKMAGQGGVAWSFERTPGGWQVKMPQPASEEAKKRIQELIVILEEHNDVQRVFTNAG